jgi:hypothetical protein
MKYYCAKCSAYYGEKLEKGSECKKCKYNGFTSKELQKVCKAFNKILNKKIKK